MDVIRCSNEFNATVVALVCVVMSEITSLLFFLHGLRTTEIKFDDRLQLKSDPIAATKRTFNHKFNNLIIAAITAALAKKQDSYP